MPLTEDQTEDILYCARVGDTSELLEAVDECISAAQEGTDSGNEASKAMRRSEVVVEVVNQSGNTPLHYAAANGHLDTVKTLISLLPSSSASLLRPNESGNTPVHWAALNGHLTVVQLLVETVHNLQPARSSAPVASIPSPAPDSDEARRAADAAAEAAAEAREDAEAQERPAWDVPNKAGRGPMSEAQLGGHEKVVQWLLEHMVLGGSQTKTDEVVPEQDVDGKGVETVEEGVQKLQVDADASVPS